VSLRGIVLGAFAAAAVAVVIARDPTPDLLREGETLRRREAYRSAQRVLERARGQARLEGDRALESDALAALARVAGSLGDRVAAERLRADALALTRDLGDRLREARLLVDAGSGHWSRAEYDAARDAFERARTIQRSSGDRAGEAASLVGLGRIPFKRGAYDEARALFRQALAIRQSLGDQSGTGQTRIDIGLVDLELRAFAAALDQFELALDVAEAEGDVELEVTALRHVAIAYLFQGAPHEARAALERALAAARRAQDEALEMQVLHILANTERAAGRHHQAIAMHRHVAEFCEVQGNLREAGWNEARLARSEAALGRLEDAEQSFRRAIADWERIGERRPLAFATYELAKLLDEMGRTEAALATYEQALALAREIALPYASLVLSDLALVEARRGRLGRAGALAGEAVAAADGTRNPELAWVARFARARVERAAGAREEALRSLLASLDVIERLRLGVAPSDEAKAGYLESKLEVYAETIDLLVELGRPGQALEVSERARARAFLDLLAAREVRALEATRSALVPSAATIAPPSLLEILAEARRRAATIVAYFTAPRRSFVFVVEPEGRVTGATIALGALDLAQRIAVLRRDLEDDLPGGRSGLRALHAALVAPVAGSLPRDPARPVVIVPHGPLYLLPFACLVGPDGSYLVEHHTLSYTPSVGVLRRAAARGFDHGAEAPRLLAVGDPRRPLEAGGGPPLPALPAAAQEARAVAALFPAGRTTVLTDRWATEARVRELSRHAAILHFATHAVLSDVEPLAGYLALAPGPEGDSAADGVLTVREVLDLELHADLVALSGCDTGLGGITGDGVSGLSRAFLHAGSASVVVSLWRVADVVGRDQMTRFHRALADGQGKAAALRRAQIETIEELRRGALHTTSGAVLPESPHLWAPFVLVGEPG